MFPPNWLPLLVVVLILGLYIQQPWLVAFASATLTIIAIANLWSQHTLDHIHYQRRWRYRRGFPGEHTSLRIDIENRKWLPLSWLRVRDPWPQAIAPEEQGALAPSHQPEVGELVNLYSLRWQERVSRHYQVLFRQRGIYPVGPARFESGDILGLFTQAGEQDRPEYLTVFPEIIPLASLHLPTDDPFGDLRSRRRVFEDPNRSIGVRSYHPEDEFRHIHWPATARSGSLQVKVYQPVSAQVMVVCLNVATSTRHWQGAHAALLEQLVKVSATIIYQGIQSGYSVGLISNGCLAHADQPFRFAPGRSPGQLAKLLEALAGVTSYTTGAFETFLLKTMPQIPYGATLVVVTALVTPELQETLVRLRRHRAHTTLLSLACQPPPEIPGVRSYHLPFED